MGVKFCKYGTDVCSGYLQRPPPRESAIDIERLNSARRRLQENYQEAQNGVVLDLYY